MRLRKFYTILALLSFIFLSCEDEIIVQHESEQALVQSQDKYIGDFIEFEIAEALMNFNKERATLYVLTPEETIIKRECSLSKSDNITRLSLDVGLKDGVYRFLYLEYDLDTPLNNGKITKWRVGLGCKITINNLKFDINDYWDPEMELYGEGTKEKPYIISSDADLRTLARKTNDSHFNKNITNETCFSQVINIDLDDISFECDNIQGWSPIGTTNTTPFRGQYYGNNKVITNLKIKRYGDPGVGLFGFVDGAYLHKIVIQNSRISGNGVVGALVGSITTSGGVRNTTAIDTCRLDSNVNVIGTEKSGGFSTGGLVGCVDEFAVAVLNGCTTHQLSNISSCLNAGGLVGMTFMYSKTLVANCTNNATVISQYSGCGGIIASGDSLDIINCKNTGKIQGSVLYTGADGTAGIGTGGIVGGSGLLSVSTSVNTGTIEGKDGVGGIIGSTRIQGDDQTPYVYNTIITTFCGNEGNVSGNKGVGGICGEGQFGSFAVYNTANITGENQIGGIVGSTSVAVVHNAVNVGSVTGDNYIGGVIGKTNFGSLAINHNYGDVYAEGTHAGGILALGSNNTMINYCGNHASVSSGGDGPVGGIVGEIGDPSEWTGMNTAECILGAVEMVMGVVGPCIAVYEKMGGEPGKAILAIERVDDISLLLIDAALYVDGCMAMAAKERVQEMINSVSSTYKDDCGTFEDKMKNLRSTYGSFSVNPFYKNAFSVDYLNNVEQLISFYKASSENCQLFNENINEKRFKRAEKLEKFSKAMEIIHATIAGACILVGSVATVASFFLTAGTSAAVTAAAVAGVASFVGGANTIWKTSTDFEENAVYITQCVNSGYVRSENNSSDKAGGIVGVLHDYGIISDCLNSGHGNTEGGGHFAGSIKVRTELSNSLTIANINGWYDIIGDTPAESYDTNNLYYCLNEDNKTSVPNVYMRSANRLIGSRSTGLSNDELSDRESFENWDMESLWTIPNYTGAFPIPYKSEYQLK